MARYLEEGRRGGRWGLKGLIGEEGKQAARTLEGYMNMAGIVESILQESNQQEQRREHKESDKAVVEIMPSEMVSSILLARKIDF